MRNFKKSAFLAAAACVLFLALPAYTTAPNDLHRWNTEDMQDCNNCYNYATNHPSGNLAQPGWASGIMNSTPYTCGGVIAGAEGDGLTFAGHTLDEARSRCGPDCCLVALVNSGFDYHWYREDANGTWSHKQGSLPARNTDAMGNPITDPAMANHQYGGPREPARNYDVLCGFMCVCRDRLRPLEGRKPQMEIPPYWYGGCPPNACHETPPNYNFPGCLPPGAPSLSPCVCCSCVLRITQITGGGECK